MEEVLRDGNKSIYFRANPLRRREKRDDDEPFFKFLSLELKERKRIVLVAAEALNDCHRRNHCRRGSAVVVVGTKIYVIGGVLDGLPDLKYSDYSYSDEVICFDTEKPADGWADCPPMITPRAHHYAAVVHNKIYVFGGAASLPPWAEVFDPFALQWSSLRHVNKFPTAVLGLAPFPNHKILVYSSRNDSILYDLKFDSWSHNLPAVFPQFEATAYLDGILYGWSHDNFYAYQLDNLEIPPVHVEVIEEIVRGIDPHRLLPISPDKLLLIWTTTSRPGCVLHLHLFRMIRKDHDVLAQPSWEKTFSIQNVTLVVDAFAVALPVETPLSIHDIKDAFVKKYYHDFHEDPGKLTQFYSDSSVIVHPEINGEMSSMTTLKDIESKIRSLDYKNSVIQIEKSDAPESYNGKIPISVAGYIVGTDNTRRNFVQNFLVEPNGQDFYVSHDVFKWIDSNTTSAPLSADPGVHQLGQVPIRGKEAEVKL